MSRPITPNNDVYGMYDKVESTGRDSTFTLDSGTKVTFPNNNTNTGIRITEFNGDIGNLDFSMRRSSTPSRPRERSSEFTASYGQPHSYNQMTTGTSLQVSFPDGNQGIEIGMIRGNNPSDASQQIRSFRQQGPFHTGHEGYEGEMITYDGPPVSSNQNWSLQEHQRANETQPPESILTKEEQLKVDIAAIESTLGDPWNIGEEADTEELRRILERLRRQLKIVEAGRVEG